MKLELDRGDLKEDREIKNCSQIRFEDFKENVQKAIVAVGMAIFFEYDRSSYTAIYPH